MPPIAPFSAAVAALLVFCAALTDLRARRIPNWLCASGLVAGIGLNVFLYGGAGLQVAGLGFGLALVIYLPLFWLRAMGGGDVKLMAALGALTGPATWIRIFLFTGLLGGAAALVFVLRRGRGRQAARNIGHILTSPFRGQAPHKDRPELDVTRDDAVGLPHGVIIAFATFSYLYLHFGTR